jgi:hypothetical protein
MGEDRAAVLRRFVVSQRARRRRIRTLVVAVIVVVGAASATLAVRWSSPSSADRAAARWVDDVTDHHTGHLRVAHAAGVDAVVYDSDTEVAWIAAYGERDAGAQLCLRGATTVERCFGQLTAGADGTTRFVWSGRADLAVYDDLVVRPTAGSPRAAALRLRTP